MAASEKYPSPDIYNVNDFVNAIKKSYVTGVDEDTLMLGTFGYFGQIMSDMFQNSIIMASEFSNESIATKAKFEKNIIAHALGLGITDINAKPAQMSVFLTFVEEDIARWAGATTASGEELPWTFVFDKNNKIYFGDYEFHTDYDIIIRKVEVTTKGPDKKFAYTAQYDPKDFAIANPVAANVKNPYLTPPIRIKRHGDTIIMTKCTIRQVEKETIYTKVLSDNDISAKTITFTYSGQLAGFSLDVTEGSETYHMIPVYEGLNVDTGGQFYFWYTYLNSDTIRIKFDRNSKMPAINASVQINLQTTQGSKGNFTFQPVNNIYPYFNFESERLNYSNITCEIRPVDGTAFNGADKKTIDELKRIIPKEALSRGSITNKKDLENHFNSMDTEFSKLYFYKKRDNCLERLYYSFMIARDDLNIIPTNTINLSLTAADLFTEQDSGKLVLKQGQIIILSPDGQEARLLRPDETLPEHDTTVYDGSFAYYLPYNFIVNQSPLYGMYILTTIHDTQYLDFSYINEKCLYQYIATKINFDRNCLEDHGTYRLTIDVEQNIILEEGETKTEAPIHQNEDGVFVFDDIDVYMVISNEKKTPLRWAKAENISFDPSAWIATFQFTFTTEDYIDNENKIRIDTGLYDIGTNYESYAHLKGNVIADIYIVSKQGQDYGLITDEKVNLSSLIPGLEGMSLSNAYSVVGGLNFFYDYSAIVSSTVKLTDDLVVVPPEDPDPTPDEPDDPNKPDPLSPEKLKADMDFLYAMEVIKDKSVDPYKMGLLYYSKYWDLHKIQALYNADKLNILEVEDILKNGVNIPKPPTPPDPDNPDEPDNPNPDNPDYYPPGFEVEDPSDGSALQTAGEIRDALTETIPGYLQKILDELEQAKNGVKDEVTDNSSDSDSDNVSNSDSSEIDDQTEVSRSRSLVNRQSTKESRAEDENQPVTTSVKPSPIRPSEIIRLNEKTREDVLADPTIYYSSLKARPDIDFLYALRVKDINIDVYELAYKYYPIYWDKSKINALVLASRLTKNEADSILGYTGDGSDRPIPEITNNSEKEIRSDIDFLYALDIVQDPTTNAYELAKLHRPDDWDDKRIESLYFADKLTNDQVLFLLGYIPNVPGSEIDPDNPPDDPDKPDEPIIPEPVYKHVTTYHITGVPVIKYDYFTDEDVAKRFYRELVSRKAYIEDAILKLEDAFEMDFKFFNTYGPSRFFTWDNGTDVIDRVNINLFFKLKLKPNYDTNIANDIMKDVKDYIEDINKIESLHIPNLITYITNRYKDSIVYFEFVSINGHPTEYQHIYSMPVPDGVMVPEFVCVNTLPGSVPDIVIELV